MDLFLGLLGLISLFSVQTVQITGVVATQVGVGEYVQMKRGEGVEKEEEVLERTESFSFIKESSEVIPLIPLK
jgi:hypothetical protein